MAVDHVVIGRRFPPQIKCSHAVVWNGSIEEYGMLDTFRYAIHNPGDYHSAIAVCHKHDILQVFEKNHIYDVINMSS